MKKFFVLYTLLTTISAFGAFWQKKLQPAFQQAIAGRTKLLTECLKKKKKSIEKSYRTTFAHIIICLPSRLEDTRGYNYLLSAAQKAGFASINVIKASRISTPCCIFIETIHNHELKETAPKEFRKRVQYYAVNKLSKSDKIELQLIARAFALQRETLDNLLKIKHEATAKYKKPFLNIIITMPLSMNDYDDMFLYETAEMAGFQRIVFVRDPKIQVPIFICFPNKEPHQHLPYVCLNAVPFTQDLLANLEDTLETYKDAPDAKSS